MSNERRKAQTKDTTARPQITPPPDLIGRWRRLMRIRNGIIGAWIGGLAIDIVLFPLMGVFPAIKLPILYTMGGLTLFWFGAACAALAYNSYVEAHIKQTFRSRDLTGLSCWIDVLFSTISKTCFPQETGQHHPWARAALLEQLPLLTEETAHHLTAAERHALYKALYGKDAELIEVILRALPVFGDSRALPFVRHLAEGQGLAAANTSLQAAAQATLQRLQADLETSSGAKGLLRASQQPQSSVEELLLPAHANSATETGELLRAEIQK